MIEDFKAVVSEKDELAYQYMSIITVVLPTLANWTSNSDVQNELRNN